MATRSLTVGTVPKGVTAFLGADAVEGDQWLLQARTPTVEPLRLYEGTSAPTATSAYFTVRTQETWTIQIPESGTEIYAWLGSGSGSVTISPSAS